MPAKPPFSTDVCLSSLQTLGAQIRSRRKALAVSAVAAAEASGVSRVTLHRIEKGEPSVTIGAWCNVLAALGMRFDVGSMQDDSAVPMPQDGWIPARIALADYPQLKSLAWQVQGMDTLTPIEALDIYERNARHLDMESMSVSERDLLQRLRQALSRSRNNV